MKPDFPEPDLDPFLDHREHLKVWMKAYERTFGIPREILEGPPQSSSLAGTQMEIDAWNRSRFPSQKEEKQEP